LRELTQALDLLVHVPDGPERRQTELMVRELRSFSAVMAGGYAAPEAADDHGRCVELCEGFGLPPELLPSLIRSHSFYAFRGELADAARVAEAMRRVPEAGGPSFPADAVGEGLLAFFRGRFGESRRLYEAFVEDPWGRTEGRPPAAWPLPNDALGAVCGHLVLILWICGERRAAFAMAERGLARARELSFPYEPFTVAYVNSLLAVTLRTEGDHTGAAACTALTPSHERALCARRPRVVISARRVPWQPASTLPDVGSSRIARSAASQSGLVRATRPRPFLVASTSSLS